MNRPPEFVSGGDMIGLSINENTPVGTVVYTLRAKDPENQRLHYYMSGEAFSVDKNSGVVKLIKPLDREQESVLDVIISVIDEKGKSKGANTVSHQREIRVSDANDNEPKFVGGPYVISVSESTQPFSTIYDTIHVRDEDSGINAQVKLECNSLATPVACEVFHVHTSQISEGNFRGSISLKAASLDYETAPNYQLSLIAKDRAGLNSTTNVIINVLDVQDEPPRFLNAPYSVTINESTPTDTQVLTLLVRDGDATSSSRRSVAVSISNDKKKYFSLKHISEDSWVLSTTQTEIDREDPEILLNGGIYDITLKAVELINGRESKDVSYCNATFIINDINDQMPHFNMKSVEVVIPEDVANNSAIPGLNLAVSDSDAGDNSRFHLMIEDLNHQNPASKAFSVLPIEAVGRSPVIIKVINSQLLDYETEDKRRFDFNVVAIQAGSATKSRVRLILSDANDHQPVFDNDQYHVQIPENVPSNITVFTIVATDEDSGDFGSIKYSLKGFGSEKFYVDEDTGEVGVSSSCGHASTDESSELDSSLTDEEILCLDYESTPTYSLTYDARDGGGKTTSVNLFIEIVDVNDNPPQFVKDFFSCELYENDQVISPALTVRAFDADGPNQGGNASIRYFIHETNLTGLAVDPITGDVKLTKPVHADFLIAKTTGSKTKLNYEATIRAIDGGDPPLMSEARIVFHVRSERDGAPAFIDEPYQVSVKENSPKGSTVMYIKATDPDGPDSELRYSIVSGSKDNFIINPVTGELIISPEADLTREIYGSSYDVTVSVIDSGSPAPLTTITSIHVTIEDVNNKPPKFDKESYVVYATDRSLKVGNEVLKVSATDPDLDAKLRFSLDERASLVRDKTGLLLADNSSSIIHSFQIDPSTGSVKVINKIADHLKSVSVIVLSISCTDMNGLESKVSPQRTVTEVTIYVQIENEKNPIFASPWTSSDPNYEITVPEESVIGSTLITLTARDSVTNVPVTEFEKIRESDPENYFSVEPSTGIVTLFKRLDYEELKSKRMTISIKAMGNNLAANRNHRPSSIANVIINVQDINDFNPQFSQDHYSASILESAQWPETVLTVVATDRDSGDFGSVKYSLSGDGSHLFFIDSKTGSIGIRKNATLDRELKSTYNLQVTATDNHKKESQQTSKLVEENLVQRRTSVLAKIMLIDVNDNKPMFELPSYESIVPENVPLDFIVGQVKAIDRDEGINGLVTYEIIGLEELPERQRLFKINPETGVLSVANALSGKGRREPYVIEIRASDNGHRPLFNDVSYAITIGDISANDGIPVFIKPGENEVITVVENMKPGSFVYQVEAVDPDNPNHPNGKVMYKFLEPIPYFDIDPLTGIITAAVDSYQRGSSLILDREVKENFTLILVAYDLGVPSQESNRAIFIKVNDTDDNEPYFRKGDGPIVFEVNEELPIGAEIARIKAIDEDEGLNAAVMYEIMDGNERGIFSIESDRDGSGIIKAMKRLDREVDESFLITIRVQNVKKVPKVVKFVPFDPTDPSHVQVEIRLRDIDDNPPIFEQSSYIVGVKYVAENNSPLIVFKASDPDVTAKNSAMMYKIKEADFIHGKSIRRNVSHVFELEPITGLLKNDLSLRSFVGGYFNLTIAASNHISKVYDWSSNNEFVESHNYYYSSNSDVNCKVFVLRDKDSLKFVFKKRPNDIRKELKSLENDFGSAIEAAAASASTLKRHGHFKLNFDETHFLERKDGSLDFESSSACFQLIKINDEGNNNHVMDFESGIKFLKSRDPLAPQSSYLKELYSNYSIISIEECVPGKRSYRISNSELGILLVAVSIGVMSMILVAMASRMKRKLKEQCLAGLRGIDGPASIYTTGPASCHTPYGVPPTLKSPSFISLDE